MVKSILAYPNLEHFPHWNSEELILRQPLVQVQKIDGRIEELAQDLIDTVKENKGLGLAANQIGRLENVIVARSNTTDEPIVMINPRIVGSADMEVQDIEGCLSFPDEIIMVYRPVWIEVRYEELGTGETVFKTFHNFMARVVCHEIDHTLGKLIIDYKE